MRLLTALFCFLALTAGHAAAQTCTISLNPASVTLASAAAGTSSPVTMSTGSSCTRTVTGNADWIVVTFGQTGTGNGTFGFTYTANLSPFVRTGTITVSVTGGASATFTVRQPGANCTYTFSPSGINAVARGAVPISLSVSTSCIWTATTSTSWLTLSSGGPFTGNGGITVSIADNPNASSRVGSIQINDQTINVQQLGISCSYAVTPGGPVAVPAAGTTLTFAVNTDAACSWSTVNTASWITVPVGVQSGPSNNIAVTVAPNLVPQSRTSNITIAGQQITISQAGVGINFTAASIQNAASFAGGSLSPGEIFVLYGTGLGPANLTTLQLTPDGTGITTSLGNTRILFDGIPAPMIYTSATQVSAIVPYGALGPIAHITVEYLGVPSTPVTVNILPATPGLFTISQTGTGQGAVRNQDFTVNSASNPATAGQALIVYWTGGGQLNPTVADGQLVSVNPPYPVVTFPMTATLGGVPAQILYSGAVPTLAPGILQTNILIPVNAPKGTGVPLLLRVGDVYATQSGVTVSIN